MLSKLLFFALASLKQNLFIQPPNRMGMTNLPFVIPIFYMLVTTKNINFVETIFVTVQNVVTLPKVERLYGIVSSVE